MVEILVTDDVFADVETDFETNPATDDVLRIKNAEAIKRSIRNIVLTNKGERPFNPRFGSNVTALLFENATPFVKFVLAEEIQDVIKNYEPRATNISVDVAGELDMNELIVNIHFTPINSTQSVSINMVLQRQR